MSSPACRSFRWIMPTPSVGDAGPGPRCVLALLGCDPAVACSAARLHSYALPSDRAAPRAPASASTAPAPAALARLPFFPQRFTRHLVLEHRLGQQLLQSSVLRLQRLQTLGIRHVHPAEFAAPQVVARLREAVLAAQLLHRHAFIRFPQEPDDLFL